MSSAISKLRDSCNACASSKLKCPKERPSCSRCASRGVRCHYSFAKRPGRKPQIDATIEGPSPEDIEVDIIDTGCSTNNNFPGGTDAIAHHANNSSFDALFWPQSPTPSQISPGSNTISSHDNTSDVFDLATAAGLMSPPATDGTLTQGDNSAGAYSTLSEMVPFHDFDDFDPKMDNFLRSAMDNDLSWSVSEYGGATNTNNKVQAQNDIASLLLPTTSIDTNMGSLDAHAPAYVGITSSTSLSSLASALSSSILSCGGSTVSSSSANSSSSASSSSNLLQLSDNTDGPPTAGQLAQTLDMLKILSSAQFSRRNTSNGADYSSDGESSIKVVLRENKQILETVGTILSSSSCGNDSFLFAVLSMTVLKILERYDAVASTGSAGGQCVANGMPPQSKTQDHRRTTVSSGVTATLGHDGFCRDETAAARLVLGELHRVQRLVNNLSKEFKRHSDVDGDQLMTDNERGAKPLVRNSTLMQLETDMRRRLSALSTEIIDRLRHK